MILVLHAGFANSNIETSPLVDEQRTSDNDHGVDEPSENAFFAMLRTEADRRRDSAQAFAQEQSRRPGVDELLEDQQRHQAQLDQLELSLGRLRRSQLGVSRLVDPDVDLDRFCRAGFIRYDQKLDARMMAGC